MSSCKPLKDRWLTFYAPQDVTATKGNEFEGASPLRELAMILVVDRLNAADYFLKRELLMGIFEAGVSRSDTSKTLI